MLPLRQIKRMFFISWVLLKHGLDDLLLTSRFFTAIAWVRFALPWNWLPRKKAARGVRIRLTLEALGPIFIKFGQILSTRRDMLPDDIAAELAKLQDQVPPFANDVSRAIIEKALGAGIDELFDQFEATPFASASIAQVHAATLKNGKDVVVKVVRPNIDRTIRRDIELLYTLATNLERYWTDARRLRPREVVAEFEKTIFDELDLMREAANAAQLRRNFITSDKIYVPEIYWDYTHRDVMVMERIYGMPVNDMPALHAANIDFKKLAENGVEVFFTQVFRDSFFHADMHPGNIFVSAQGKYIAVDFGIMGSLNAADQRYLAENFLAFFKRDYRRVAQLHIDSGWVDKGTRIDEFEFAIRTVCEPIFDRPIKEISFGNLLIRLFQVAQRFNMEVQPQLILLQKTLLNIEGLGRQLYPDLDLWTTAKPFLERWMAQQIGPRALFRHLRENIPLWAEQLPKLPNLVYSVLEKARAGEIETRLNDEQMRSIKNEIKQANRRTVSAIIGSGLILSATVFYSFVRPVETGWQIGSAVVALLGVLVIVRNWPRK